MAYDGPGEGGAIPDPELGPDSWPQTVSAASPQEFESSTGTEADLAPPNDARPDQTGFRIATDDPSPAPSPGAGRFEILGEIARGGMGVILRGRDAGLNRDLAVKIL